MLYTFLYGIDAIFRIHERFFIHTLFYFLTFVISIIGWIFLKNNKSLLKSCLGFILVPAFPLFDTLFYFEYRMFYSIKEKLFIVGILYFTIFVLSFVFIMIKTKKNYLNKSLTQSIAMIISGLMIFTHSYIELVKNFVYLPDYAFFIYSIILIVFYYLRVLIVRFYNRDVVKAKKLNLISNFLFWIYIFLYDFSCFGMAAASV